MSFTPEQLILFPLLVQLVCLALFGWLYRKRSFRNVRIPKSNIYRCTNCKKVYIDPRVVPLSKCPKCLTLNEAIRR